MCTALSWLNHHHYFGRNLDLERGYGESVVITPRRFPFKFRYAPAMDEHYAMIGMAAVSNDYPLYFEATNEKGLSMAGLNFPGNAVYAPYAEGCDNIAPFELIPWLLGQCADIAQVREKLAHVSIVNASFSESLPVSPLHWLIADRNESITLECAREGMKVYDDPYGVLTNNPPFDFHLANISRYMGLNEGTGQNALAPGKPLQSDGLGFGAIGLPGDFSSVSRFVRAVFVKEKALACADENAAVHQFFHMLLAVAMPKGCVLTPGGEYEYTRYSCCCNTDTQTYCYNTYQNLSIRQVELHAADVDGSSLIIHPVQE